MASLNTATNGPSIKSSYQGVINSKAPSGAAANSQTYGQWAIFSVSAPLVNAFQADRGEKESILKVQSTGEGELIDLIEEFSEGRVQFAYVKVKDTNTSLPKYVLIGWCGEGVPERTRGYFTSHLAAVGKILHGYHVQITARSDRDLTPETIIKKVADSSGAKYSAGSDLSSTSNQKGPTTASKPVFKPTQISKPSAFNPLAGSRSMAGDIKNDVDDDGWGKDAPQVTRSQLEKVPSAYKPTKVNMAELIKQKSPLSQSNDTSTANDKGDIVKGGYQPVGKVDIAAIRAQAQDKTDDRPTVIKGAYEPVGKVDISAIRARAQKPTSESSQKSPTQDEWKVESVANRSAVFSQSERLTSLPKPKITKKFGPISSSFTGTKPPNPGAFGLQSAPATFVAPIVGSASKTFADEGGKTPAQVWQEKKARERGLAGASNSTSSSTTPIFSQPSGGTEWKSGYTGKSWAPVATNQTGRSTSLDQLHVEEQGEETSSSPSGGIGAIRDRFQSGAIPGAATEVSAPPPVNTLNRPVTTMPPPPQQARSPTPESPQRQLSPARIAIPVARTQEPNIQAPEERNLPPALPKSVAQNIPAEQELPEENAGYDPGHGAAAVSLEYKTAVDANNSTASGRSALIQYDYEKAEDNELELVEGEYVTNIEMVDDDWWMGTNSRGESGLFPSNYVELLEEDEPSSELTLRPAAPAAPAAPVAPAEPAKTTGPSAIALYDYEAAEDNELSFEENDVITNIEFPDEDWWHGYYNGSSGLFPANYVQLNE